MARRELQEINAGSMADIAFLLLLFFLVSATMDTDMGIVRKLPAMPDENTPQDHVDVKARNVFVILVNRNNQLLVEGKPMNIKYLRAAAKEFISNPGNSPDMPAKEIINVRYFGKIAVTKKHVISLQNDRGTSYEMYIAVQNELAAAYNELRNELALQKFGMKYSDMEEDKDFKDQCDVINEIYPMQISEAEPKNVGG
jgi:biopolymer transport protein ExbD